MAGKTKQTGKSPRTRAANDEASAQDKNSDSTSTQAFAAQAKDLGALREAVVDAAGVGTGLWLSYLFLFFYLFVAVAAVTHKDLFFENPVKLPFLNVELPLIGFFWLGPLLFLILHAYVLLHLSLLAGKVGAFHDELQAQITDVDTRARLRRQLPSNIFVQYLAGSHEVRTGFMGFMLRAIAIITLIVFPVALLVFFQLQFLPYHSAPITWWHRIAVLIDIILLWRLWPSIALGQAKRIWHDDLRHPSIVTLAVATFVSLLLVFTIATFPDEWLDSNLPTLRLAPTKLPSLEPEPTATDQRSLNDHSSSNTKRQSDALSENEKEAQPLLKERWRKIVDFAKERWWNVIDFAKSMEWTSLHDLLVGGDVDLVARKPRSLWSNRLVLPGIDVIDRAKFDSEEKIKALPETLSLRGRRLEGAILIDSVLRKADLTAAQLQGAVLLAADLRDAKFICDRPTTKYASKDACAQLQRANLIRAQLQGADLSGANLQRANLRNAQLQGANLRSAHLQGANMEGAKLQGADLRSAEVKRNWEGAQLQGANLESADLQGENLSSAKLKGANLQHAELQGAVLEAAELEGANLTGANLQGAHLFEARLQRANLLEAKLQGADLKSAQLQRANMEGAKLQGADLESAKLEGANLIWAEVWLAKFPADLATQSGVPLGVADLEMSPLTSEEKTDLADGLQADITDGELLKELLDRLNPILQDDPEKWEDEGKWSRYIGQAKESSPDEIVQFLADMACGDPKGHITIVIAERATDFSQDAAKRQYAKPLARALLNEKCEGARALTEDMRATLENLVAE